MPGGFVGWVEDRTRKQILLTWNPDAPFWATKLEDTQDDIAVIHSTYKDNPFLEQNIIDILELRADSDPYFYRVFVLGEYGTLDGLIFKEEVHWTGSGEPCQESITAMMNPMQRSTMTIGKSILETSIEA